MPLNGAQLILIPAEWPCARQEHWRTLLRARAIENQCFVAGCNRVGTSKEYAISVAGQPSSTRGARRVVEGGEDEELLTVTVDMAECAAARARIPVFDDRRPELY